MIDESKYDYIGVAAEAAFGRSLEYIAEPSNDMADWHHDLSPGWWEIVCMMENNALQIPISKTKIEIDEKTDTYLRMKYL